MGAIVDSILRRKKHVPSSQIETHFEDVKELEQLVIYIAIVNHGQGDSMIKLFKSMGTAVQFVQLGEGTANKSIAEILNIQDNQKEIVYSFVRKDKIKEIKARIDAFFASNKKISGVAFTCELSTLVGVQIYKFLTNSER